MKILTLLALFLGLVIGNLMSQQQAALHLTKISSIEWVDLSKVAFVRTPAYTAAPDSCTDCQVRWGADLVVDGVAIAYSEEAELTLKRLLILGTLPNQPPLPLP